MAKNRPTAPAPQNRRKRAEFFMKDDQDSHSKAELLKLAIAQERSEFLRPKSFKPPKKGLSHV